MPTLTKQLRAEQAAAPPDSCGVRDEFGCRQGWLRHLYWQALTQLGVLRRWRRIDWPRVRRLVFVCQGNICRSVYAERRAATAKIPAISCGLNVRAQASPPEAIRAAAARRLNLAGHQPTALDDVPLAAGDLLVAMEPAQAVELYESLHALDVQVTVLGLWSTPPRSFLQDPYGLSDAYFQRCFELIDTGVSTLAAHMETRHAVRMRP